MVVASALAVTDCRTSCIFQNPTATAFGTGKFLDTVLMPPNFQIQFDVLVEEAPCTTSEVRGMLELADSNSGQNLFKVGITNIRNILTSYNGVTNSYVDALLNADYTNTYTTVLAGYNSGTVTSATSNDYSAVDISTTSTFINTTNHQYDLYIAGMYDVNAPTAVGFIKNIYISGTS